MIAKENSAKKWIDVKERYGDGTDVAPAALRRPTHQLNFGLFAGGIT